MTKFDIKAPKGFPATTTAEALEGANKLGGKNLVIKAQILAGGRGLGKFTSGLQGGVHLCDTAQECQEYAEKMLGHTLVTKQTGAEGKVVNTVFISERYTVAREMYFAIMFDRSSGGPVMIASPKGGVNIEDVAANTPQYIFKESIHPINGPTDAQLQRLAEGLCEGEETDREVIVPQLRDTVDKLWTMFDQTDASMLEINPLAELAGNEVLCLDAKVNFDDNASFRQQDIHAMRDLSQEDAREVSAAEYDLNYIGLDGSIGCLVNGAGLAMATMDIIKHFGAEPANFLDVGGGATEAQVREAIKILDSDKQVKAILVNIFGGIMRCDVIASGLIKAAKELNLQLPLVVRLEGTKVEEAKALLAESDLKCETASSLDEAAQLAVKAIQ